MNYLEIPWWELEHPLENDCPQGPGVREERGPLALEQDLGGLARVEEGALGQRRPDHEALEVVQPEVGDLGLVRVNLDQDVRGLEVPVDDGEAEPVKVSNALRDA